MCGILNQGDGSMGAWAVRCVLLAFLLPLAACQSDDAPTPSPVESARPSPTNSSVKNSDPNVRWLDLDTGSPSPLAVHPQGDQVAVRTHCETIVYDLRSGQRRHSWANSTNVSQFSADGQFMATTDKANVGLWDTEKFVELHRWSGNPPAWNETDRRGDLVVAISDHADLVAIANSFHSFDRDLPCSLLLYSQSGHLQQTIAVPDDATIQSATFLLADRLLLRYNRRPASLVRSHILQQGASIGNTLLAAYRGGRKTEELACRL